MSYQARTGVWINWDRGAVTGATITLSARDSQILSSFLAALLTLVGVQLWKILSFTVHQARATHKVVDGLHRQQQLVWKHHGGAASSAWIFLKQMWSWRRHARRSFIRTFPLAVLSAVYAVGLTLLAIFAASEITKTTGPYRLVKPGNCGYYNATSSPNYATQRLGAIKTQKDTKSANNYVNSCYPLNATGTPAERCSLYRVPSINWTASTTESCPWPGLCGNNGTFYPPFIMDTGLTDSHKHWGINARPEDRVQFRKVTTCAPVNLTPFETLNNKTNHNGGFDEHISVNLGPVVYPDTPDLSQNYTFDYDTELEFVSAQYYLDFNFYQPGINNQEGWQPMAPLNRSDADMILMLLATNEITSVAPITDPIFRSDVLLVNQTDAATNYTLLEYTSPHAFAGLGCMEQFSFCNPNNGQCQGLGSTAETVPVNNLGFNEVQMEAHTRIFWATQGASMTDFIQDGGANLLQATSSIIEGVQNGDLPPNQWQIETSAMFDTGLARMQQAVLEFATGPTNTDDYSPVLLPRETAAQMCKEQMVSLNDSSVSYSVLGLAVTVGISALIVLVSLVLEEITGLIQRTFNIGEHRRRAWILDSNFQLHRQLCERDGFGGTWYNLEDGIPVCDRDAKFGSDGQTAIQDLRTPLETPAGGAGVAENSPFIPQSGAYDPGAYAHGGYTDYATKTEHSVNVTSQGR